MKFLVFLCTIILLFSCKKESVSETITVELSNCSEQLTKTGDYTICFDSIVEDSRCPANVVCVWQGIAKAKFRFNLNNQVHHITLSTNDLQPHYSTDTTIAGYHIKLSSLLPYPATSQATPTATIVVTH